MKIPAYHIDAFAGGVFSGNPAMVCPLEDRVRMAARAMLYAEGVLHV